MAILFVFLAIAVLAISMRLAKRVPLVEGDVFGVSVYIKVGSVVWGGMATFLVSMVILDKFDWDVFWVCLFTILIVYLIIAYFFRVSLILRANGFYYRQFFSYKEFHYSEFKSIFREKFVFVLKRGNGGQITIPVYLREASSFYSHVHAGIETQAKGIDPAKDVRS